MISKVPRKIQEKFYIRLEIFVSDINHPLLNNHSVEKAYPNCRSINVTGDYRAIFKKEEDNVYFIKIGIHSELYS